MSGLLSSGYSWRLAAQDAAEQLTPEPTVGYDGPTVRVTYAVSDDPVAGATVHFLSMTLAERLPEGVPSNPHAWPKECSASVTTDEQGTARIPACNPRRLRCSLAMGPMGERAGNSLT